ncbi:hypothetical protein Pcinc_043051, partial [Petrolisthes cinctipes]
ARCHPDHPYHHNTSLVSNTTKPHPATTTAAVAWKENAGRKKEQKSLVAVLDGRTGGRNPSRSVPRSPPLCLSPPLDINPARGDASGPTQCGTALERASVTISPREKATFWDWKI